MSILDDLAIKYGADNIVFLPLTKGRYVVIDKDDYESVKDIKWFFDGRYAANKIGKKIYLHRILMKSPKGEVVDHINGDKLDCRKSNLRICTQQRNTFNRTSLNKNNTSGHIGITWSRDKNKWLTRIMLSNKSKFLGYFEELEDAISARKKGEILYGFVD